MSAPEPVRIFISAGERSGDVHGANFIRAVHRLCPGIQFEGFGGPRMKEAGCHLHRDMLGLSVMWTSFLGYLVQFFSLIRWFWWHLRERPPRALVLIDYPGLHFILARIARARGIPVVYYICPQIWAWAPWRRRKIIRLTDLLMVILPFEEELYRNPRVPVCHVGHPLADELLDLGAERDGLTLRSTLGLRPGGRVVGIFPGSRLQEVRSLMPLFRKILDGMGLDPEAHQVLVSSCRADFRALITEAFQGFPVPLHIEEGDSRILMAACDFALVASGTASLELAFFGKPMIVLYRVAPHAMFFYRWLGVNPFISLVNIIGRGEVVPERVVVRREAGDLAALARDLLLDTPARRGCLKRLDALREEAFQPGGTERAARRLLAFLQERGTPGVTGFPGTPAGGPREEAP